jgi:hypothetical protein
MSNFLELKDDELKLEDITGGLFFFQLISKIKISNKFL